MKKVQARITAVEVGLEMEGQKGNGGLSIMFLMGSVYSVAFDKVLH